MERTILFMDNTPAFLDTYSTLLENAGYRVIKALSLEEAEDKLKANCAQLAILDVRMVDEADEYDISGLLLARKEEYKHLPKIILTAHPSDEYKQIIQNLGPERELPDVKFLGKDQGFKALIQTVNKIFKQYI
jgi:DNA-binding NtrC family response regulator